MNTMNTEIRKEEAAIRYETTYTPDTLEVSWEELRQRPVGFVWKVEDQDCWPNRQYEWSVTYTKIFEDETGILVKYYRPRVYGYYDEPETTLMWFSFLQEKPQEE